MPDLSCLSDNAEGSGATDTGARRRWPMLPRPVILIYHITILIKHLQESAIDILFSWAVCSEP